MTDEQKSHEDALACLDEVEIRKAWPNSAGPWCLVHVPTGKLVPTWRALPDGRTYQACPYKLKRDAIEALAALRAEIARQIASEISA